jgi:hypothetical protein
VSKSPSDFVSTFLESVGRQQDVDLYLRIFRQLPKESFAVVAAEPAVLRHAAGVVVEALRFLSELDLHVTLAVGLLGDGGPANGAVLKKLADAEIPCEHIPLGDPASSERLQQKLQSGGSALIDLRELPQSERKGTLGTLLQHLATRKLVVLRSRGGLGPHKTGQLQLTRGHTLLTRDSGISVVNLTTDLESLLLGKHLGRGESELLRTLAALHGSYPSLLTSVTSPFHLISELFTVKGAGTLLKTGSTITRAEDFSEVDIGRLSQLISETFGKHLKPQFAEEKPLAVYLEQNYRGAAVLHQGQGATYLSKFAVSRLAQGEGIGRDLWEALTLDHPALYWRADPKNPIVDWYARECDGMQRTQDWIVYWRGVSEGQIPDLIKDASSRKLDFLPPELEGSK